MGRRGVVLATLGLLVVICAFALLGRWQWSVARPDTGTVQPGVRPVTEVVPLEDYVPPAAIGSTVTVSGSVRPDLAIRVPGRTAQGRSDDDTSCWIVVPVQVTPGVAVAVVTAAGPCARPPLPAEGPVALTGVLQPAERVPDDAVVPSLGQSTLPVVATDLLVHAWPFQLYDGYVVVDGVVPLMPTPPPARLDLRNAAYAVQWWFFAAFAIAVWWRAVRPEDRLEPVGTVDAGSPSGDADQER